MSWIDKLLVGVSILQSGGVSLPQTSTLNFGSGLTAVYNASAGRVDLTSAGGGSVPTGTGFSHVTGGLLDTAARAVELNTSDVTGTLALLNGGTGLSAAGSSGQILQVVSGALAYETVTLSGDTSGSLASGGSIAVTVTQAQAGAAACRTDGTWYGALNSGTGVGYSLGTSATAASPFAWSALTLGYPYISSGQGISNSYALGLGAGGINLSTGTTPSLPDLHISNPATNRYICFEFGGGSGGDGCLSMSGNSANGTGNGVLTIGGAPETSSAYNKLGASGWLSYLSICVPTGASAADPSGTPANSSVLYCAKSTGKMMLLNKGTSTAIDLAAYSTGGISSLTGDVTAAGPGAAAATVARVNGATVPAAGALTPGQVLQVTGASALGYAALNLAGGANYVSGTLPAANLPFGTAGQYLITNSGATASSFVSMSGDAVSSLVTVGRITVSQMQGGAVACAITTGALTWPTTATPTLSQATLATVPVAFTIQAANVTTGTGSALVLTSGTGSVASGALQLQSGGVTVGQFAQAATDFVALGGTAAAVASAGLIRAPNNVSIIEALDAAGTANITLLSLNASNAVVVGDGSANLGSVFLNTNTTGGVIMAAAGATGIQFIPNPTGTTSVVAAAGVTSFQIRQNATAVNSATGATLSIQAQNATGTTTVGGALALTSGTGTTTAGNVNVNAGATLVGQFGPSGLQIVTPTVGGADFGGGVGVLSLGQVATTPTAQAASSVLLWGSSSQQLVTGAIALLFSNLQTGATVITHQVLASTSAAAGTAGTQFSLLAQNGQATTFASGAGGTGGLLFGGGGAGATSATGAGGTGGNASWNAGAGGNATGGTGNGGPGGTGIVNGGAGGTSVGGTAGANGGVSLRTAGVEVVNFGLNGLGLVPASQSIAGSGTTTLALAVYKFGLINLTGALTGASTVVFPNAVGTWLVVISALTGLSGTNTLTFQSGSATTTALTSLTTGSTILIITTTGSNGISINL